MAGSPMTSRDGFLGRLDPVRWYFLAFEADFWPTSKCTLFIPQTSYSFSSTKPAIRGMEVRLRSQWKPRCPTTGGAPKRSIMQGSTAVPPRPGFLDPRRVPPQNARGQSRVRSPWVRRPRPREDVERFHLPISRSCRGRRRASRYATTHIASSTPHFASSFPHLHQESALRAFQRTSALRRLCDTRILSQKGLHLLPPCTRVVPLAKLFLPIIFDALLIVSG
jgi:hypothetical protein